MHQSCQPYRTHTRMSGNWCLTHSMVRKGVGILYFQYTKCRISILFGMHSVQLTAYFDCSETQVSGKRSYMDWGMVVVVRWLVCGEFAAPGLRDHRR